MWYRPENESTLSTPAVLVYPDRIEENIVRMIAIAGSARRIRPHVKTHKTAEVIKIQLHHGITKFKCATLSEVELVAATGGRDILLAYPLLGSGTVHFLDLMDRFPEVQMAVTVDSRDACIQLMNSNRELHKQLNLFVDLDNGMHRTGIPPEEALKLIEFILSEKNLSFQGLHVYDGHIHEKDLKERKSHCNKDFESVQELISKLEDKGIGIGELACGGTPTFPIHAGYENRTLCPGTPPLWDAGYARSFPDLDFLPAAVLAGQVISKPDGNVCINLGHKAVASEMPHPRLHFLEMELSKVMNHSEEHLVISGDMAAKLRVGDLVYALPTHICPTMALHDRVYVVLNNRVVDTWKVTARNRYYPLST